MVSNLELVQAIFREWEEGRYGNTSWADHDLEYEIVGGPAPGKWRGVDAMREAWSDFLRAWSDVRIRVVEARELDDERVFIKFSRLVRGATSGVPLDEIDSRGGGLFHCRDGKVQRLVVYLDDLPEL